MSATRWIAGSLVALALGLGGTACRAAGEAITVAAPINNVAFAYIFVALDKGYFAAEGLEPQVTPLDGSTAISALIAGSLDYSASPASAISAIVKGAPLKVIFFAERRAGEELWSFDPAVTRFDQMNGKMIVIGARGGSEEVFLRELLKSKHLPVNFVGFTAMGIGPQKIAALASGYQQFAMLGRLEQGELRREGALDKGRLVVDFTKEIDMPNGGMATSDREIALHRDRARRVMRALVKGMLFMRLERDATVAIVAKRFPQVARDEIVAAIDEAITNATPDGTISPDAAERELSVRGELLGVGPDAIPPVAKAFDFSLLDEVQRELKAENWQPAP